ncbi:MAG: type II secretion system protein [Alphaproteobacteria bacterium]|nr:type II secretion system protein [Alphaproteobacteria bacterium]
MTKGYSLLELIVVLGIVALLIVVAAPTVQASVERMTLTADTRTLLTALRRLREQALDQQADIVLNVAGGAVDEIEVSNGETIALTPGTAVRMRNVVIAWDGTIAGTLNLARGEAEVAVTAEPLTGRPIAGAQR